MIPASMEGTPTTSSQYTFFAVRLEKDLAKKAAARCVRASSSAPLVSLSSRWTSLGRDGASNSSPSSRRSTRSEEHTSELQSLMRISYAVFCLKKKKQTEYKKRQPTTREHTQIMSI